MGPFNHSTSNLSCTVASERAAVFHEEEENLLKIRLDQLTLQLFFDILTMEPVTDNSMFCESGRLERSWFLFTKESVTGR